MGTETGKSRSGRELVPAARQSIVEGSHITISG